MRQRFFVEAALLACATCLAYPSFAQTQTGRASTASVVLQPNGPEAFSNAVPLTPEQHELLNEKLEKLHEEMLRQKGQVSLGPQTTVPRNNRETTPAAAEDAIGALPSPTSFFLGRNAPYPVIGGGESSVAEPSIANSGGKWFVTQNWSRGFSNNAGTSFTAIPDDAGPADAPSFCCDQDAVHDHGRDATIWSELFIDSNLSPTTGVIRLHVRAADNLSDACTYDINGGRGVLYDYPHLGLGNNYLYITANTISNGSWSGATIWRYHLDQIATCASINGNVFTWTGSVGQVVWVPARGTTDTMYLVTIENSSQNRYFVWPENSNAISFKVLNVASSNYGAATCTGGTTPSNWLGDALSTSSIGFQIRSAVGQDGSAGVSRQYVATYVPVNANGSTRPQAYVAGSIIGTDRILSASSVDSSADIFNTTSCFSYSDVTANSRGDLGLAIGFGGSSRGGGAAQSYLAISDDVSRGTERGFFGSVFLCASANDNPTRWGDYLTARVQEPVDVAFIAAGYGDVSGSGKVRVCEYMRGRYAQAYLNRHLK